MVKIKRALISVFDKNNLEKIVKHLDKHKVEIVSTGGTLQKIQEMGINVTSIGNFTKFPEMLDGRVKTLHPKVHGGLLAIRDSEEHQKQMSEHNLVDIDMVIVNLYPFAKVISQDDSTFEEAIENIDIGGPAMLRSAAKNHKFVAAIYDSSDYDKIITEMDTNNGALSQETRFELARKVFNYTSSYDATIAAYLNDLQGEQQPLYINLSFKKKQKLRYGENPHQEATLYGDLIEKEGTLVLAKQIQGKELSFNNILDFDAALNINAEFKEKCVVIIKHNNPAGVAIGDDNESLASVFENAWSCDPVSAFGSIIAINKEVDEQTAQIIANYFIEGVIAPGFQANALQILEKKKNLRLLETGQDLVSLKRYDLKRINGGLLVQEEDAKLYSDEGLKIVTDQKPTAEQMKALEFIWRVTKYVKSNAICLGDHKKIFGVGAGQMSRVDSVNIAGMKAKNFNHPTQGCVLGSDAFFPFRDGIDQANEIGVKAIIQPGGSVKDPEVIAACNEYGIAMVFTGMRHFKH